MALERLEHRQVGPVVGLGDDPAEAARPAGGCGASGRARCDGTRDSLDAGLLRTGYHPPPSQRRFKRIDAAAGLLRSVNRFAKPVCHHLVRMIQAAGADDHSVGEGGDRVPCLRRLRGASGRSSVTIADVAEAAGVSEDRLSFAFNNSGRLAADTATADHRDRRYARLPARPRGPDAHPAADRDDRPRRAPGTGVDLLEPASSACSARASRRSPRMPATPSISSRPARRCRGRSRGRPSTGGRDRPCRRPPGDRRDPAGRSADDDRRL